MKRKNLKTLAYSIIVASLLALGSIAAYAEGVPSELAEIQREGHYYYTVDRKVSVSLSRGEYPAVKNVFQVLPKNSPGSCTHEAAIKVKMLKERMPDIKPLVMVYETRMNGMAYFHAVVLVFANEGVWILDNKDMWVDEYASLPAFLFEYSVPQIMPIEMAQKFYGGKND